MASGSPPLARQNSFVSKEPFVWPAAQSASPQRSSGSCILLDEVGKNGKKHELYLVHVFPRLTTVLLWARSEGIRENRPPHGGLVLTPVSTSGKCACAEGPPGPCEGR